MIEIDVDKNRPKNFASKEEANDWEEKTLRDILRFKKLVEDGKFVPEEVVQRLQAKGQLISKCPFFCLQIHSDGQGFICIKVSSNKN